MNCGRRDELRYESVVPLCADNTFPANSVRSAKIKKRAIRAEREAGSGKREAGSGKA
ncbi:hypothetical protein [Acetobacter persici]|uniref:hypothetical protein n=1 Tax=Acetobacter persici TaxID=1076596 RepID=UPI0039ECFD78